MKYQSFVCYRLNPNQKELSGDVTFEKNIDGRIFSDCILKIENHIATLTNSDDIVQGVINLEHCYLLNYKI